MTHQTPSEELRIALVMNGGVSLAVWIGGVTREVGRLVAGEDAYGELLALTDTKPRVDVICGTSAGGLNGAYLALALAHGRDLSGLRHIWVTEGSISGLLRSPFSQDPPSFLDGDGYFLEMLRMGFRALYGAAPKSPADVPLDLVITTTLLRGRLREHTDDFGARVVDVSHRGQFRFSRGPRHVRRRLRTRPHAGAGGQARPPGHRRRRAQVRPRDGRVIAEQVRSRQDLRPLEPASELDLKLRLLVGRRRDLVAAQTQRLARLHHLLVGIFPGLERALDLTTKGPLVLLTWFVTPAELRAAGKTRLGRHLKVAGGLPKVEALAERALAAADQPIAVPAERMTARVINELAGEALATRTRLAGLDRKPEDLLDRQPDAALIRSLPSMGAVLTAELIAEASLARFRSADALAAAAGMAPVLRQSRKVRFLRRPRAATRGSNASSTIPPSAPSAIPTTASCTIASGARENATTRPSSLSRAGASTLSGMLNNRQAISET